MPGTQPRGMHAFDPSCSSAQSLQMLDIVNVEEDGAEDQDGPPVTPSFPHSITSDLGILGFGATPSVASELLSSLPLDFSSSGDTRPPSSSSLPPTAHPHSTQQCDASMGSTFSHTNTDSDPGNTRF
jgi:hypothetical protein